MHYCISIMHHEKRSVIKSIIPLEVKLNFVSIYTGKSFSKAFEVSFGSSPEIFRCKIHQKQWHACWDCWSRRRWIEQGWNVVLANWMLRTKAWEGRWYYSTRFFTKQIRNHVWPLMQICLSFWRTIRRAWNWISRWPPIERTTHRMQRVWR